MSLWLDWDPLGGSSAPWGEGCAAAIWKLDIQGGRWSWLLAGRLAGAAARMLLDVASSCGFTVWQESSTGKSSQRMSPSVQALIKPLPGISRLAHERNHTVRNFLSWTLFHSHSDLEVDPVCCVLSIVHSFLLLSSIPRYE